MKFKELFLAFKEMHDVAKLLRTLSEDDISFEDAISSSSPLFDRIIGLPITTIYEQWENWFFLEQPRPPREPPLPLGKSVCWGILVVDEFKEESTVGEPAEDNGSYISYLGGQRLILTDMGFILQQRDGEILATPDGGQTVEWIAGPIREPFPKVGRLFKEDPIAGQTVSISIKEALGIFGPEEVFKGIANAVEQHKTFEASILDPMKMELAMRINWI